MLNVLKMDLFRLKRSKSFYVTIIISIAMAAFVIWAMKYTADNYSDNSSSNGAVTVSMDDTPDSIDDYIDGIFNGNYTILFVVIFIVIFCNAEVKNGYIKNVASIVSDKYKTVTSKIIMLIIYVLAIYAALLATILIACYAFLDITNVDSLGNIAKMLGTGILMNISLGSLVVMFFTVVGKSMIVMPSSIVYVLMGQNIFQLIKLFTKKVLSLDSFDAFEYTNLGNMNFVSIGADCETYVRALIVGVVVFVISYIVAVIAINKKDIN